MNKCENCIHFDMCAELIAYYHKAKKEQVVFFMCEDETEKLNCPHYKDKSLCVELPCKADKIGEYVYYIPTYADCIEDVIECKIEKIVIYADRIRVYMRNEYNFCDFSPLEFSQRVVFDKEDAEAKLKEIEGK